VVIPFKILCDGRERCWRSNLTYCGTSNRHMELAEEAFGDTVAGFFVQEGERWLLGTRPT
jgi:hypothetical protein